MRTLTRIARQPGQGPTRPQIEERRGYLDDLQREWIETELQPFILYHLNKLQKRLRYPVMFAGSPIEHVTLQASYQTPAHDRKYDQKIVGLSEDIQYEVGNNLDGSREWSDRARRWPELIEIYWLIEMAQRWFENEIGYDTIYPTVKPWKKPKRKKKRPFVAEDLRPLSLLLPPVPMRGKAASFPSLSLSDGNTVDGSLRTTPLLAGG